MAKEQSSSIVFMGTPEFAEIVLNHLARASCNIKAVYTQPDKAAGRKMLSRPSQVKKLALQLNLPVMQPLNFRDDKSIEELAALEPDFLIVAAYGLLLPQAVLDIPRIAPINLHGSLLPKYRGAAPIQRAIMENWQPDAMTGVSIMKIIKALDAGPVYGECSLPIGRNNWGTMAQALATVGAQLLIQLLPDISSGELQPRAQDDALATYAPKLTKKDGIIQWDRPVLAVDAQIRGVTPWPGAKTVARIGAEVFYLTIIRGCPSTLADQPPGTIKMEKKGLQIACLDNWYQVEELKPEGRKIMTSAAFANGLHSLGTTGCIEMQDTE